MQPWKGEQHGHSQKSREESSCEEDSKKEEVIASPLFIKNPLIHVEGFLFLARPCFI